MSHTIEVVRKRIQAQGYCGFEDAIYKDLNWPLRMSPAICMLWTAIGTYMASPLVLWLLVPFAALGAILPFHPFDIIYNYGLRHISGMPLLPDAPPRRRFACFMAAVMLVVAAWSFQTGLLTLGYVMGWSLVAAAFVNVSTGFCVPSFVARIFLGEVKCQ